MGYDSQVPWTDEQWARVNQAIQEEAKRARVAATFLPLYGPLDADTDFVRRQEIRYPADEDDRRAADADLATALQAYERAVADGNDNAASAAQERFVETEASRERQSALSIDDRDTMRLATLQVIVPVRNAQMADPELASALALFRRAANVVARLEDAVVFRGLAPSGKSGGPFAPPGGIDGLPSIWQITGASIARGLWRSGSRPGVTSISVNDTQERAKELIRAISDAVGRLEGKGQFGPFAVVLGQKLFLVAQTPDPGSLVLPQDRIIPFLGGGPLLRSSTLEDSTGVVVALGGAPIELVVASDMSLQFLQLSNAPVFLFRVSEKIALRIREPDAIVQLVMEADKNASSSSGDLSRGGTGAAAGKTP